MTPKWTKVSLGKVLKERQEFPTEKDLLIGNIRIISKIGFSDGKILLREESNTRTKMILIRPGDLVVSGINAAKGAIAIYDEESEEPVAATIHYGSYIPDKTKVDIKYLWWLLRSHTFRDLLSRYVPGGIKTELKPKRLLPIPIPLPSLPEQRRIVEKINQVFNCLDTVKKYRAENNMRINYLYDSFANEIFSSKEMKNYLIPMGKAIDKGIIYLNRESRNPQFDVEKTNFVYIDISSVNQGPQIIRTGKIINCVEAPSRARRVLHKNDIIFSTVRPNLRAVARIGKELDNEICSTGYAVFSCSDNIDSNFLLYQMSSAFFINQCMEKTTGGHYPAINDSNLRKIFIAIPPIEKQRIIAKSLISFYQNIRASLKHEVILSQKIDALLPSILDKAFKGEL